MQNSELLRFAGLVFIAVTCVVMGDTAGKLLGGAGMNPFFIAWTRFSLATALFLPFSGLRLHEFKHFADRRVLLRGLFITCGIGSILTALKTEPIANVYGAFFIGPVVAYVLAIVFLGEKPSRVRGLLLALGFLGVILVVKPGFGATKGMGFALMAGIFFGAYMTVTKLIANTFRPRFLLFSQLLIGSIVLAPLGLSAGIPPLNINLSLLVLASALGSAVGNYLLVIANQRGDASLIAPLVYSQLFSATILGILVFGDWPDVYSLLGLAAIMASGLGSLAATRRATLMPENT